MGWSSHGGCAKASGATIYFQDVSRLIYYNLDRELPLLFQSVVVLMIGPAVTGLGNIFYPACEYDTCMHAMHTSIDSLKNGIIQNGPSLNKRL